MTPRRASLRQSTHKRNLSSSAPDGPPIAKKTRAVKSKNTGNKASRTASKPTTKTATVYKFKLKIEEQLRDLTCEEERRLEFFDDDHPGCEELTEECNEEKEIFFPTKEDANSFVEAELKRHGCGSAIKLNADGCANVCAEG